LVGDDQPTRTGFCWIRRWPKYVTKDTRYDVAAGIRCYEVLDGMGVAERINKKAIYRLGARMLF